MADERDLASLAITAKQEMLTVMEKFLWFLNGYGQGSIFFFLLSVDNNNYKLLLSVDNNNLKVFKKNTLVLA